MCISQKQTLHSRQYSTLNQKHHSSPTLPCNLSLKTSIECLAELFTWQTHNTILTNWYYILLHSYFPEMNGFSWPLHFIFVTCPVTLLGNQYWIWESIFSRIAYSWSVFWVTRLHNSLKFHSSWYKQVLTYTYIRWDLHDEFGKTFVPKKCKVSTRRMMNYTGRHQFPPRDTNDIFSLGTTWMCE